VTSRRMSAPSITGLFQSLQRGPCFCTQPVPWRRPAWDGRVVPVCATYLVQQLTNGENLANRAYKEFIVGFTSMRCFLVSRSITRSPQTAFLYNGFSHTALIGRNFRTLITKTIPGSSDAPGRDENNTKGYESSHSCLYPRSE
jgi:hypothetical protein